MNDNEKIIRAKQILQEWVNQQGHERCWYYPDVFNKLSTLFDIRMTKTPSLPPLKEFEEGCRKYQMEEYKLTKN